MDDDQQFCLRWNNHQSTLISVFDTLLENGTLVDCTLAAEGKFLKAHKVVLSACSPYFATLLSQQYDKHPIFILKDVKFQELRAMMDYMYRGEVNISQDQLAALLKAAESLQIKGLSDSRSGGASNTQSAHQMQQKPNTASNAKGFTIEHKRSAKHSVPESDMAGSREGSTSPTARKRKRIRRRSITDANSVNDNHDHSNSSSHSVPHPLTTSTPAGQQLTAVTSVPTSTSSAAGAAANTLNVTKKTDIHDPKHDAADHHDGDDQNDMDSEQADDMNGKGKHSVIEPKHEYDDGNDEPVEDLTLDEEEMLDDLDQPGPSHGGEGSSQGYSQWQIDRAQDDVYLSSQDTGAQNRDAQENLTCTPTIYLDSSVDVSIKNEYTPTGGESGERYKCQTCNKSYLRKRHLHRHMRDECIGIPPRFPCELCPSKFRRKYHLVRHHNSKHAHLPMDIKPTPNRGTPRQSNGRPSSSSIPSTPDNMTSFLDNINKLQVQAIMMKNENFEASMSYLQEIQKRIAMQESPEAILKEVLSRPM